jgi:predicted nucleic acid-binding protein
VSAVAGPASGEAGQEDRPVALLGGSLLIALHMPGHVHAIPARSWLESWTGRIATSPITQGTLVRTAVRLGSSIAEATILMDRLIARPKHGQWWDDIPYDRPMLALVRGHSGVTDAYLAALAGHHGGRLATLDRRLGDLHPDVALVIPT